MYLQSKHFNENGQLIDLVYPELNEDGISDKHILKRGDVLFAAKGNKNFAAWYDNMAYGDYPAVASTSFFVIRLNDNTQNVILPEYLAWFINHPVTQNYLKNKARGTSMASISKVVLEELEISIPDLQTQKTVLKIAQLRNKEKRLKQKIETLKEKQIQQHLIRAINYKL